MRITGIALLLAALPCLAGRVTVSLDGTWHIADSVQADAIPASFDHTVPVPGLAHSAVPAFPDIDRFDSREIINNRVRRKLLPESAVIATAGIPRQSRNWFWYQTAFRAPARKQVAILKINKAQFGTAVWLNGRKIGEHLGCFSAGYFDLTGAIDWQGENRLIVRIGAHPAVLPAGFPSGTDFEKNRWTPGIYDDVSVMFSDNPVIETVQVAPRLGSSSIEVEVRVKNYGTAPARFAIAHTVRTWKQPHQVAASAPLRLQLAPGEQKTHRQTIAIPGAHLWTPEDPFLYVLDTSTGGDSASTRFGMREFRFDTATRRAYLNGQVYFLRGSNITLHRFFEDPQSGTLPWDDAWVRKLLVEIPKRMHWNTFRFCIGPAPDKWLDIADEAGLLIQNEYFVWTGHPDWRGIYERRWDEQVMVQQYSEWMRDNWNHASVAFWDANNESYDPIFEKIIPVVRKLDLSNRQWENSYNPPVGPDDPGESHPYLFIRGTGGKGFNMQDLERMSSKPDAGGTTGHAVILNEYGWLWLNRDGRPTELTGNVYKQLLGENATPAQRFAADGYLLGGLTEFWRAHREFAGVLHFVYLTACYEGAYTCDHFQDLKSLTLEPNFADYVGEAFKPLGVYLNFWHPTLKGGETRRFTVMMVNDGRDTSAGQLSLTLEAADGTTRAKVDRAYNLPALGQQTYEVDLQVPALAGEYVLQAAAGGTRSRRNVRVE